MKQLTLNLQGDSEATGETMKSSSLVASRNYVNHSARLEKEKELKTNATCGERCFEQYKKLNPNLSLQKMSLASQILTGEWYSSRCALIWKLKGTKFSRLLFQLQPKTHHIGEIGFGLLLKTPTASDWITEKLTPGEGEIGSLSQQAISGRLIKHIGMLPTPSTTDSSGALTENAKINFMNNRKKKGLNAIPSALNQLRQLAYEGLLPTPTCQDSKRKENSPSQQHKTNELSIAVAGGSNSQLNPRFVAEMMGFPPNWTELPFQSGERKVSKDMETQ